jgi:hypothetical protein
LSKFVKFGEDSGTISILAAGRKGAQTDNMRVRLQWSSSAELTIGLVAAGGRFFKTPFLDRPTCLGKLAKTWG